VHVTWGNGASLTSVGDEITVFPVLKGRQGQYISLTTPSQEVTLSAGNNTLWLPSGKVSLDVNATSIVAIRAVTGWSIGTTTVTEVLLNESQTRTMYVGKTSTGGLSYNIGGAAGTSIRLTLMNGAGTANQTEEALVLREEADKDNNEYHVILPVGNDSISGTVKIQAGTPDFTYGSGLDEALKSDTQKTQYVDKFGVFVERDARDQDTVKVWYPDEQMKLDLFVLATGATVTSTAASGGQVVKEAVPIKTSIAKLDTEVTSADKTGSSLILVGGPAVNTLVADLASQGKTKDVQWYRDKGAGTALIELVADAFTTGKSALVVAGHSAPDTRVATGIVQNFDGNTDKLQGVRAMLEGGTWTNEAA